MANYFEVVSKYKDANLTLPTRATANAAGYDLAAAEDVVIHPYLDQMDFLINRLDGLNQSNYKEYSLEEMANLTKSSSVRPKLISTGMKCHLDPDKYLELVVRSSSPLKYWLICANSVGIIDADYYNNPDNEGEIFLQVINLSPFPIKIQKGEKIAQGIIKQYNITKDDNSTAKRVGGFGSTT